MSDHDIHQNTYNKLRSVYKYYIDSYNTLYQLKTEKEEELNKIYKMIKTELIDSKKHPVGNVIKDIFNIIPFRNRYTKSYLSLAKRIFDEYNVKEVNNVGVVSNFLFYKEYGINLDKYYNIIKFELKYLDIHAENTIYRAIMYNDLKIFIFFIETEGFDKN
ncbi:hypothetical protein TVAG_282170 [Trichomonas vaginalis G3]|uniref:DUF3447 domain-containing protein n=1 Tax=Trichomonas vaginalis (strain ATCC PRA-98 / G3) TaxID=412133 RepID=A2E9T2_TRIV3|nr:protein ubiquitination [Trichomonas vaginalis G3]EAY10617.1 hypothetical protein TVAG_282170 [Trichomonas vaginalis G3]KAI5540869.1 protein ubiquitination [Trichomonas vaginalis G3]|eukprot:XP_001322840.1 hypothetical protein [Trichomonas vaginalis G3]